MCLCVYCVLIYASLFFSLSLSISLACVLSLYFFILLFCFSLFSCVVVVVFLSSKKGVFYMNTKFKFEEECARERMQLCISMYMRMSGCVCTKLIENN